MDAEQTLQINETWARCSLIIKERVPSQTFKTWFEPIVPIELKENKLIVGVPSQFFYEWVEEHYSSVIAASLEEVLGQGFRLIYQVVRVNEENIETEFSDIKTNMSNKPSGISVSLKEQLPPVENTLNPRYTFSNFIMGESNQLARAAALAVANNPGKTSFNPFVIYGGTGLGKTHLIQAIGNQALSAGVAKRVVYISSERFTIEFVDAIQSDTIKNFSSYYRSMDVLIVDDIQFLSGKEKTQDSFFHTFNSLHQLGKQIVLSSDKPPKNLKGLDERLISRFQWGLTADVQAPDLETRIAILQQKCEEDHVYIPQEVINFLAANVTSNIRELEGTYISLIAKSSLENKDIDILLARDVLRSIVSDIRTPVSVEKIQKIVAEYFNIPVDMFRAKNRKQEVASARMVAMFISKELTNCSLKTIGLHFGGRDHSTVIHALQTVEDQIKLDSKFRSVVDYLRKNIESISD
ncbi:MAG: chromosomal replication initiator protein DnaA [Bacteroidetes bacterium]|nr:chromosomal replication initiator protein DnaA [Bacteroidota bacterium]